MGVGLAGSLALLFVRLPLLRSKTRLESLVSREATFLYNNLLLVALTLTILWGVAYPLVYEAVVGESRIVGRGYYDFFVRVFGLPLLLLMGIGPLVAWRRASLRSLALTFAWPAGAALLAGLVLLALGAGSSIPGLIAYTFSTFVLASIALEFIRGTRARRSLSGGSWPGAFSALVARNRRRYGGYVVHAADRPARDRDRRVERLRQGRRGEARARPVARGRRLPAHLPFARGARGCERDRDQGARRRRARR